MSSPKSKASAKSARRAPATAKPRIVSAAGVKSAPSGVSADAIKLAKDIEVAFQKSGHGLSAEAMQRLMAALCNTYSAQVEGGARYTPIAEGQVVSPTAVMVTASGLLRAANLAVFELGMWQSWTGR